MVTVMPDAWQETFLGSISVQGGSEYRWSWMASSMNIDIGDKEFDMITLCEGGRLAKFSPEDPVSIECTLYENMVGGTETADGDDKLLGIHEFFTGSTDTGSDGPSHLASRNRNKHRVTILFTDDSSVLASPSATAAIDTDSNAYRFCLADCYVVSADINWGEDRILSVDAKFRGNPFDKDGNACYLVESAQGSEDSYDVLPELTAYTSSNKFR